MNRVLCILKDMESGITLMKDKDDKKDWTPRDIYRMKRKKCIKGYDTSYYNNLVIFDTDNVQYIYLVENVTPSGAIGEEEGDAEGCEDELHPKWDGALPLGSADSKDYGGMFR